MPNFDDAKIYMICSTEGDKIYINTTTQPLNKRFNDHLNKPDNTVLEYLKLYKKFDIKLIENFQCENRVQLKNRMEEIMTEHKDNVFNYVEKPKKEVVIKIVSKRTVQNKLYYENNKEHLLLKKSEYGKANSDAINEQRRAYREANKDSINQKARDSRNAKKS